MLLHRGPEHHQAYCHKGHTQHEQSNDNLLAADAFLPSLCAVVHFASLRRTV